MTLKIKVHGLLSKVPPPCQKCSVRYKSCGLKPESCTTTFYPISDKEIEFILQTNENLPEDEDSEICNLDTCPKCVKVIHEEGYCRIMEGGEEI